MGVGMGCRKLHRLGFAGILGLMAPITSLAADPVAKVQEEDSDTLFLKARNLAREKRREEARALCRKALLRSPGYSEIRVYLARLHAWDGQYDQGRQELRRVLDQEPENLEARMAWIDLESWADRPAEALRLCDEGLARTPNSEMLMHRKARVLKSTGDIPGALAAVQRALALNPDHQPSRLLRDDLKELNQRSKIGLDTTYETFDKTFDPWRMTTLSGSHRFDFGSIVGRVNRAERFGDTGTQVEVDAYPRIREGTYLYLNAGWSGASIFPEFRSGGEIFNNFRGGIEGSLGFRYLRFSESSVTIYTGSVGKYWGDYLFTVRINVTPGSPGSSVSGSFSARKYLEDADSYLSMTLGTGVSPDQPQPSAEILRLRSRKVGAGIQKRLGRSVILSAGANLEWQELRSEENRQHRTFSLGLEKRF